MNGGERISDEKIKSPPSKRGNAPVGGDNQPVELHHKDQTPTGPIDEMTRKDHRGGENYKKNHNNTGKESSKIDRKEFDKQRKNHWRSERDKGRWGTWKEDYTKKINRRMTYFKQFISEKFPNISVVIEDDGKVCYGYLLNEEDIVSDVWIYNQAPTPKETDWSDYDSLPFLNPKDFVKENLSPFTEEDIIEVSWIFKGEKIMADVLYFSRTVVRLVMGEYPGYSTLVKEDGPLAKILRE